MLSFLADENFHSAVTRGLRLRSAALDVVRVQDVGLSGVSDPDVPEWAAQNGRILLTHDVRTMTRDAYDRVRQGFPMPGVIEARDGLPHGQVIEDILTSAVCGTAEEYEGRVVFLPL